MSFASYYLPSSGDNWTVRLDVEMSANLQETTPFTVNVYEGSNSTGTLLETVQVDVYRGSAKRTIEVDLIQAAQLGYDSHLCDCHVAGRGTGRCEQDSLRHVGYGADKP